MAGESVKYTSGVHANYDIAFRIDTAGLNFTDGQAMPKSPKTISDAEGLSISIDGGVEEWNPMDGEGWTKRLVTAKSITISMTAKRNSGDPGNDYIAGLFMKTGNDCYSFFDIIFPNGDELGIPCVVNVTSLGGDSTAIDAMEFEILSHGKPEYIKGSASL